MCTSIGNEVPLSLTEAALQGGKAHNCNMRDRGPHPESLLWEGLGNESTLVKVDKQLWFWLNLNLHVVSEVTGNLFCIKPNHDLTLNKFCVCLNVTINKCNNAQYT